MPTLKSHQYFKIDIRPLNSQFKFDVQVKYNKGKVISSLYSISYNTFPFKVAKSFIRAFTS